MAISAASAKVSTCSRSRTFCAIVPGSAQVVPAKTIAEQVVVVRHNDAQRAHGSAAAFGSARISRLVQGRAVKQPDIQRADAQARAEMPHIPAESSAGKDHDGERQLHAHPHLRLARWRQSDTSPQSPRSPGRRFRHRRGCRPACPRRARRNGAPAARRHSRPRPAAIA